MLDCGRPGRTNYGASAVSSNVLSMWATVVAAFVAVFSTACGDPTTADPVRDSQGVQCTCIDERFGICVDEGGNPVSVDCGEAGVCTLDSDSDGAIRCIGIVCEPGEARCGAGGAVAVCASDGMSWLEEPCDGDATCSDGACVSAPACDPGAGRCTDGAREQCLDDGSDWAPAPCDDVPACADSAAGCACDAGACVPRWCEPGAARCGADGVVTCDDGFVESAPVPCDEGATCIAGTCIPAECVAGDRRCLGDRLLECASDGGGWRIAADCAASDLLCLATDDADVACRAGLCTPGASRCADATTVQTCGADATWAETAECDADFICEQGLCRTSSVGRVCAVDEPNRCEANHVMACVRGGGVDVRSWVRAESCGDDVCVDGACRTRVCAPDEAWCDGPVLQSCSGDGLAFGTTVCAHAGQVCDADIGACRPPVCVDGAATDCIGDDRVDCLGTDDPGATHPCGPLGCADGACVDAPRETLASCSTDAGCASGRCSNGRCVDDGQIWIPPGRWPAGFADDPLTPATLPLEGPEHAVELLDGRLMHASMMTAGRLEWPDGVPGPVGDCDGPPSLCPARIDHACFGFEAAERFNVRDGLERCLPGIDLTGPRDPDGCLSELVAVLPMRHSVLDGCTGWRVPTEAEWAIARREGRSEMAMGSRGLSSCLGAVDDVPASWSACDGLEAPRPASTRAPNGWGAWDLPGNVRELVADLPRAFDDGTAVEPFGGYMGSSMADGAAVIGCGFEDEIARCRAGTRPDVRDIDALGGVGFRLIRTIPTEDLP